MAMLALGSRDFDKVDFEDDLTAFGSYTSLSRARPSLDELDEYEGTYSPLADLDDYLAEDVLFGLDD